MTHVHSEPMGGDCPDCEIRESHIAELEAQLQLRSPGCLHDPCSPALDAYIHECEARIAELEAEVERLKEAISDAVRRAPQLWDKSLRATLEEEK